MATPFISVVVCTRQRPVLLRGCLTSLLQQTVPLAQYEIVVVDNSADDAETRAIAQAVSDAIGVLHEPRVGLARARNCGWRAARGDVIAFLDDDAEATPLWIETIRQTFTNVVSPPLCVGGSVEPLWDAPRPIWLTDKLLENLSLVNWSDTPRPLAAREWIVGCNMAFRRTVLQELGGFAETLGRRGAKLLGMEEILLQMQLRRRGDVPYYQPALIVRHHIAPERLTPRWFVRRAFWNGVSRAHMERELHPFSLHQRMRLAARAWREHQLTGRVRAQLLHSSLENLTERCAAVGWLGYCAGILGAAR